MEMVQLLLTGSAFHETVGIARVDERDAMMMKRTSTMNVSELLETVNVPIAICTET